MEEAYEYLKNNHLPDLMFSNLEREEDVKTLEALSDRIEKMNYGN